MESKIKFKNVDYNKTSQSFLNNPILTYHFIALSVANLIIFFLLFTSILGLVIFFLSGIFLTVLALSLLITVVSLSLIYCQRKKYILGYITSGSIMVLVNIYILILIIRTIIELFK